MENIEELKRLPTIQSYCDVYALGSQEFPEQRLKHEQREPEVPKTNSLEDLNLIVVNIILKKMSFG